jgi:phospholipid/cholesterol/gamma-HCH transport system substrate-binding protein
MENRSHALIAGLFTLILGCAVAAAFWWFGGRPEEATQYLVVTQKSVTGLSAQGQVRYRGIRVGKVESIALDPSNAHNTLIRISVRKTIPITRGTYARLGTQGLTGIAHLALEDNGKDDTLLVGEAGHLPTIPMHDSMLQELTDLGGETLRTAREFLVNANEVLSVENRQAITRTLANLDSTMGNLRETTAQLKQVLTPERLRLLDSTLAKAEHTAGEAGPFFAEARGLVARLQAVTEKLDATLGDSTSGGASALVPRLNELGSELSTTSRQLGRVLQMLEESPQSLIFGRPREPGPGEPGFVAPPDKGQP